MTRKLANWLESYATYASVSEAPRVFHFWAGVSAIAGALRRRVWFDQVKFQWYPSFYIIFVGHPGIVTKSVTADGSMDLLREVPGIYFGPDEITWQQLVTKFADSFEEFRLGDEFYPMSPLTILSSEFGMMMDFRDSKLVNLFITLWDGRKRFEKETKMSGNDTINAPWINLIACTTPQWINDNMSKNIVGGGFTSRCIFVYGEKKEKPIAYIKREIKQQVGNYVELKANLIHDLEHIATQLAGEYTLTPEAEEWGVAWYEQLWSQEYKLNDEEFVKNYIARKQAHLHKLAMILAAAQRDSMVLTLEDLQLAKVMLEKTEQNFRMVFSRLGQSPEAQEAQRILQLIQSRGEMAFRDVIKIAQIQFPNARDFEGILASFIRAGQLELVQPANGVPTLRAVKPPEAVA